MSTSAGRARAEIRSRVAASRCSVRVTSASAACCRSPSTIEFSISTIQVGSMRSPSSGRFCASTAIAILARTAFGVSWAGLTPGSVAEAATAVPRPVVYNHAEGWGDPATEPGNVTVGQGGSPYAGSLHWSYWAGFTAGATGKYHQIDRKSTRLNSSHLVISYA